jgi:hypothetical protein
MWPVPLGHLSGDGVDDALTQRVGGHVETDQHHCVVGSLLDKNLALSLG